MSIEQDVAKNSSEHTAVGGNADLAQVNRVLKHRIKNLFLIANSICQQTIKSSSSPEHMSKVISGRIQAVAAAEEFLSSASHRGADMSELVKVLVNPLSPDPSRLFVDGTPVTLPSFATTPFALILHELATNALKHGAWSPEGGRVDIRWRAEREEEAYENLVFDWSERGGPSVSNPDREGLGSSLIKHGLPEARVDHQLRSSGLKCRIVLPLS